MDGAGNITSGEEDFSDLNVFPGLTLSLTGTYLVGVDGRGVMTLTTSPQNPNVGSDGVQIISFTMASPQHLVIAELDKTASASGQLDLQTSNNFTLGSVAGPYAFGFSGLDTSQLPGATFPLSMGGVLSADGQGNFTSGSEDINDLMGSGTVTTSIATSGSYSSPDSFGRGTAQLGSSTFVYYVVNSDTLRFLETDAHAITTGPVLAQGPGSFSNTWLSGNFAFTTVGNNSSGALVAGGLFAADGNGNLNSAAVDVNNAGVVTQGTPSGTYSVAANGRGTLTFNSGTGGVSQFAIYSTTSQGILLQELDQGLMSHGAVFGQSGGFSASTLEGTYALSLDPAGEGWVGLLVSDGVSAFTGGVDINLFGTPNPLEPGVGLTGSFSSSANGRFTGTLTTTPTGTLNEIFYLIDDSNALVIGTDPQNQSIGTLTYTGVSVAFAAPLPPATIYIGRKKPLRATVNNDPANAGVDWTASCGSADCGSFNPAHTVSYATAIYTAPATPPAGGVVTLNATSTADNTRGVRATVSVFAPPTISFAQTPPSSVPVTGQVGLIATVAGDATNAGVDWSCNGSGCGSFNPVHTASGATTIYTAPATPPTGGSLTITATATADPLVFITAAVQIVPGIVVTFSQPPPISLPVSATAQVAALVYDDPMNLGLDWTVTCGSSACGSFSPTHTASGATTTFTAPASIPKGNTVTLIATSTADPTKSVAATVTILSAISITLTQAPPASLLTSAAATVSATVSNDPNNEGVDWTVSCGSASCGSFSPAHTASGVTTTFTAPATVPTGRTVTITATSTADPTQSVTSVVVIVQLSVAFTQAPPSSMLTGTQAQMSATVTNDSANEGVDWTVSCGSASCGSFSPTHTASGAATTYTAPATQPAGSSVIITAAATANSQVSVAATVQIGAPVTIALTQAPPASLLTSATAPVSATVSNDPNNKGVDWTVSCSSASCGSFSPTHTASGAATTYTAPASIPSGGTVTITATSTADTTKSVQATVTITSPAITVSISQQPPPSIQTGGTAQVVAVVAGDSTNSGVDWSATCAFLVSSAECGSFNPSQTASGSPTTYTAPPSVPPGNEVTITATSVAVSTTSANAIPVQISALLQGQYAFLISGQKSTSTSTSAFYVAIGSITADGAGRITSGNEDFFDEFNPNGIETSITGYYSIGADGRGTITLTTPPPAILDFGANGVETLSFAMINPRHGLITEFDLAATSSGTLDIQDPSAFSLAAISGNYAFSLSGVDTSKSSTEYPLSLGGVLTADGKGTFTAGAQDINDLKPPASVTLNRSFTGSYEESVPNPFGRGTADFSPSSGSVLDFYFYVVDSGTIRFIETDAKGLTAGSLFAQGAGPFSNGSLSGSFAFTDAGSSTVGPLAAGGLLTLDGSGNISSGTLDVNNNGTTASGTPSGTYAIASNGRGTLTFGTATNGVSQYAIYLTSSQGNLLLGLDSGLTSRGTAFSQSGGLSASSLQGNYALNLDLGTTSEEDIVGQAVADGVGSFLNMGKVDINSFITTPGLTPDAPLTGAFTANSNGRFTGKLTTTFTGDIHGNFYVINPSNALFLGVDGVSQTDGPGTGVLQYSGISVSLAPKPTTVQVSSQTVLTATVNNDPSNAGVDWSCGGLGCGSFNAAHTASGASTTYTAPAAVPASGTVTITATSTADSLRNATLTAAVTSSPVVSIALTIAPPASLATSTTASVTATVSNDSSNEGVDWSAVCSSLSCGSFSPTHTPSGVATTYTAPAAVPVNSTVTIIATATADATRTVTAVVTLTNQVTISLTTPPPSYVYLLSNTGVTATVSNDASNQGVDWSVTCSTVFCGSVTPAHTPNGSPTTYNAPSSEPGTGLEVSITATATANINQFASQDVRIKPVISTTFTVPPPPSIQQTTRASMSAAAVNGLYNLGVDWTVTCGSADCGSFNPTHTANSETTKYTAPATIPAGGTVTIRATSTEDPTSFVTQVSTITSIGSEAGLLKGQYAFVISGVDQYSQLSFSAVGSIVADGAGNITTGEEDYTDQALGTVAQINLSGIYHIGSDGRGQITLVTNPLQSEVGINGVQTLGLTMVGSHHGWVTAFDDSATASGSLDFQTTADFTLSSISGGYAFTFFGYGPQTTNGVPPALSVGGVVTADGAGHFTSGVEDLNDLSLGVTKNLSITGTYQNVGAPDAYGRGESTLGSTTFVYYIVDSGTLRFVENDYNNFVAGSLYAQGSGTLSNSSLSSGSYAFTATGRSTGTMPTPLALGGIFNSNGNGAITSGNVDVINSGASTSGTPAGTYSIGANGRGTLTLTSTGGVSQFAIYPTANQGVLLLELDSGMTSTGDALLQTAGISAATFQGNYAANVQAITLEGEEDLVGQAVSDGASALTGTVDFNLLSFIGTVINVVQTPNATLSGAFTANSNGRFTGAQLVIGTNPATTLNGFFYVVNSSTVQFLGIDSSGAQGTGVLQLQLF
jgi:hypothetical protein